MRTIQLDASCWRDTKDFYKALLMALEAPDWHGYSINALVDSMIWGGINAVNAPYEIQIRAAEGLPNDVAHEIILAKAALTEARVEILSSKGYDVDVSIDTKE